MSSEVLRISAQHGVVQVVDRFAGWNPAGANRRNAVAYALPGMGEWEVRIRDVEGRDSHMGWITEEPLGLAWASRDQAVAVLTEDVLYVLDTGSLSVGTRELSGLRGDAVAVDSWGDGFAVLTRTTLGSALYRLPVNLAALAQLRTFSIDAKRIASGVGTEFLYVIDDVGAVYRIGDAQPVRLDLPEAVDIDTTG